MTNKDKEKDEADFSGPEDQIEFEERMKREGKADSFDSVPHEEPVSRMEKAIAKRVKAFLRFIGSLLQFICIFILIFVGLYWVSVWWDVLENMSFLEFSISLVLFFITIPIAPIYIGIHGNWEPLIYVTLGIVVAFFIFLAALWCLDEKD